MAEQLLVSGLTATSFQADAASGALPPRAQTVVVGAGIVGASIAYHLSRLGHDVLVIDRASVAAGTSWHAAGLVARGRSTGVLTDLAGRSLAVYRCLEAETGVDVNLVSCGSLLLARTPGRMDELAHSAAVARSTDVPHELLSPAEVQRLVPLASTEALLGGFFQPEDGHLNPGLATLALAVGAHQAGTRFAEGVRVLGIRTERGRIIAVETDRGVVECEQAVLAAGLWTRDLAAACRAGVPLYPAEHVHVRSHPVAHADPGMPVLRDMDASLYVRHLNGCLLVGAFEPEGKPVDARSLPDDFAYGEFSADWAHFASIRAQAEQRMPVLREVGYDRFLNAPESFTPDANPCLGETAEVAGLFVAAGFNSQGIIFGPGAGQVLAEWIVAGAPTFDTTSVDVQRFSRQQSNRRYLHERTTEGLGRLYAMHWPHLQPHTARYIHRSPLHDRVAEAGACFGEVKGFEVAHWYAPPGVEPAYDYSFGRQNWFEPSAEEHRATRSSVALFDLSGGTMIDVAGPDALRVLQGAATADCDRPVGQSVATLFLNARGGIELEGQSVRLAADRFLVLTSIGAQTKALAILRRSAAASAATVTDLSSGFATIALVGPRSLELLQGVAADDLVGEALAPGEFRELEVGRGYAWCLRVDAVGEQGVQLFPPCDLAVDLYDQLCEAGRDLGLRLAGYHALDSIRVESGLRRAGLDTGPTTRPADAGLDHLVAYDKPGGFRGLDALRSADGHPRRRRPTYLRLLDPEPLLRGGEAILRNGRIVGTLTSGAYGHSAGAACGLGLVDVDAVAGSDYAVDCAGALVAAELSDTSWLVRGGAQR